MGSKQIIHAQTSGSTGHAKQLSRDAASWVVSAQHEALAFGLGPSERFFVFAAATHSLWAYAHFRAQLIRAPVLGVEPLQARHPSGGLSQLSHFKPTVIYTIPDCMPLLLHAGPAALGSAARLIVGGGAWPAGGPIEAQAAKANPRMRIQLFYGSAECSFVGLGHPEEMPWYRPFPDVQLREVDGELHVKSPMTISPGDWIATGDRVQLKQGGQAFQIMGRSARTIRILGKDLQPEPIEEFLCARGFCEIAAIMLETQNRGRLVLFYRPGHKSPDASEIRQAVSEAFPHAPAIHRLIEIENWPRLPSGKTNFDALK